MITKKKFVYFFGEKKAEGNAKMKDLLGGKGANLAEMVNLGVPVPPGFTITTEACNYFYQNKGRVPAGLDTDIKKTIEKIEKITGKKFGSLKNPLLFSVRSGAKFSMPGMMDTILNLGLNDQIVLGLARQTKNPKFAYDSYRRFIQMFGNVVLEIEKDEFEDIFSMIKKSVNLKYDHELSKDDLEKVIKYYKKLIKEKTKKNFPQDVWQQLVMARNAVFRSWNNPRAKTYRRLNKISDHLGTAINVQAMVFGNMGETGATGVGFTRDPATGQNKFYGEYLVNAQGEDVVSGVRTPEPIEKLSKKMPKVYQQLKTITKKLEKKFRDIQDFEFTIEDNKLYILQTRNGKRTAQAAIKIAVEMVREKLISKEEAILRVEAEQIDQLLHPVIDAKAKIEVMTSGLPASPGVAVGKVVFNAEDAVTQSEKGSVILVRTETCPDDIHGMEAAQGILTSRGGMTSHAAVVARGMGKCCVAGCEALKIDEKIKKIKIGQYNLKEGDWITLNGSTGEVILDKVATVKPKLSGEFGQFMKWVDQFRRMGVRANTDVPRDAKIARDFGAEGIGLCRTEHMFFAENRLPIMQKMILAEDEKSRRSALKELLPFQIEDLVGLFREMKGYPVTIRLIDPPLHEFLPKTKEEAKELSKKINVSEETIWEKTKDLHEFNPMLGHRGCRLGITYPEITEMQVRAIISAACHLAKKEKIRVVPEIMVPLIGHLDEFTDQKNVIVQTAQQTIKEYKVKIKYLVGTMIEVPRAALIADQIAEEAEFFSFGTNDLTQMGMGFSRDDAGRFIKVYLEKKILPFDPFRSLDQEGIGQLIEKAIKDGRRAKKDLKIGICGEHGGDPESVDFCYRLGMNYVSCSAYRVPIACLAAAQAAIRSKTKIDYSSK